MPQRGATDRMAPVKRHRLPAVVIGIALLAGVGGLPPLLEAQASPPVVPHVPAPAMPDVSIGPVAQETPAKVTEGPVQSLLLTPEEMDRIHDALDDFAKGAVRTAEPDEKQE